MASSATNGKAQTNENRFLQKLSDNNANPNAMRSTGAIPKTKNPGGSNTPNGEKRAKLNNNVQEIAPRNEINGTCYVQNNAEANQPCSKTNPGKVYSNSGYLQNNAEVNQGERPSSKTNPGKFYGNSGYVENIVEVNQGEKACAKTTPEKFFGNSGSVTNGFKNLSRVHNGSLNMCLFNQLPSEGFLPAGNNKNNLSDELQFDYLNGSDAGPSTSRGASQPKKGSESESSSDTGNDDLSCSDECCIYTYKGDVADLPSSFMNLDLPDNVEAREESRGGSRGSSPEMDFLEMDFDPGPSCDADSDESSVNSDIKSEENFSGGHEAPPAPEKVRENLSDATKSTNVGENEAPKTAAEFLGRNDLGGQKPSPRREPEGQNVHPEEPRDLRGSSICHPPQFITANQLKDSENRKMSSCVFRDLKPYYGSAGDLISPSEGTVSSRGLGRHPPQFDQPWLPKSAKNRTTSSRVFRESKTHHSSTGDLISPSENILPSGTSGDSRLNTSSSLYHSTMEKQLFLDKNHQNPAEDADPFLEKSMIWTEQEAALKQITQIGTSACGATAVLNVLLALGHPLPPTEKILEAVKTRLRSNSSPLIPYLKSRSVAGSTHKDLIRGLTQLSEGQIYARFFSMYPERYINLSRWLSFWIKKGAVPVATLNLQKGIKGGNCIPDAWHHQMLFGVGPHGVYLTNPLERVEEGVLWHQLSSDSVLLVKREDVVSRWNNKTNLRDLVAIKDIRWHKLNVVGQVANVIREHHKLVSPHAVSRKHICIPAAYSAGITLAIDVNNPACDLLKHCPELPLVSMLP